jgi:hypothetical protein
MCAPLVVALEEHGSKRAKLSEGTKQKTEKNYDCLRCYILFYYYFKLMLIKIHHFKANNS